MANYKLLTIGYNPMTLHVMWESVVQLAGWRTRVQKPGLRFLMWVTAWSLATQRGIVWDSRNFQSLGKFLESHAMPLCVLIKTDCVSAYIQIQVINELIIFVLVYELKLHFMLLHQRGILTSKIYVYVL